MPRIDSRLSQYSSEASKVKIQADKTKVCLIGFIKFLNETKMALENDEKQMQEGVKNLSSVNTITSNNTTGFLSGGINGPSISQKNALEDVKQRENSILNRKKIFSDIYKESAEELEKIRSNSKIWTPQRDTNVKVNRVVDNSTLASLFYVGKGIANVPGQIASSLRQAELASDNYVKSDYYKPGQGNNAAIYAPRLLTDEEVENSVKMIKEQRVGGIFTNVENSIIDYFNEEVKPGVTRLQSFDQDSLIRSDNIGGQVCEIIGGMIPNTILAGSPMGTMGSMSFLWSKAYGSAAGSAYNKGASIEEADTYAVLSASLEVAIEMLAAPKGGVVKKGDSLLDKVYSESVKKSGFVEFILDAGGEVVEEEVSNFLTPFTEAISYKDKQIFEKDDSSPLKIKLTEDFKNSFKENFTDQILMTALTTALSTIALGSVSGVSNGIRSVQNNLDLVDPSNYYIDRIISNNGNTVSYINQYGEIIRPSSSSKNYILSDAFNNTDGFRKGLSLLSKSEIYKVLKSFEELDYLNGKKFVNKIVGQILQEAESNNGLVDADDLIGINEYAYNENVEEVKTKLAAISPKLVEFYEQGKKAGNELPFFLGFEEHNFVHVERVAQEAKRLTTVLNELISLGEIDGYSTIDSEIVYKAGLAHDLGMKESEYYFPEEKIIEDGKTKTIISKKLGKLIDNYGFPTRVAHPLNSALTILQNSDIFGEDTELIACLALIHSKSTSRVNKISSHEQMASMVETLYNNQYFNGNKIYNFDASKLVEVDSMGVPIKVDDSFVFKNEIEGQFKTAAVALRIGDAHAKKTGFNQGTAKIFIVKSATLDKNIESRITKKNITNPIYAKDVRAEEAKAAKVIIINSDETRVELKGGDNNAYDTSKQIVLGERNVIINDSYVENKMLVHSLDIKTTDAPASTWKYGISDKFEEYLTCDNIKQKVKIKIPCELDSNIGEYYCNVVKDSMTKCNGSIKCVELIPENGKSISFYS